MSTASGAILAMGTVFSHNIMRQLGIFWPNLVTADTLLLSARLSSIPFALAATLIASYYGDTGYLLIVASEVVLATVVAPLFGCFYAKNPSPRAAFLAVISGAFLRVLLEFTLPKDGFLLLPFNEPEFEDFGTAASAGLPVFFDAATGDLWNPAVEECKQTLFEDYTGVDSMSAFLCSVIIFITVQTLEHRMQRPLFHFPGDVPYDKMEEEVGKIPRDEVTHHSNGDVQEALSTSEVEDGPDQADKVNEVNEEVKLDA
jgi:Na+/proline symporter